MVAGVIHLSSLVKSCHLISWVNSVEFCWGPVLNKVSQLLDVSTLPIQVVDDLHEVVWEGWRDSLVMRILLAIVDTVSTSLCPFLNRGVWPSLLEKYLSVKR